MMTVLWTFVEVPEKEELPAAGCGAPYMTEQIHAWVPKHAVETQHHLQTGKAPRISQVMIHRKKI